MLRGRLALASVYLCFVCLLALRPQTANKLCTRDIIPKLLFLLSRSPDKKWLDCRLYTPNITDYQNCPKSAMKCFADEVKVLTEEWETVKGVKIFKLSFRLELMATELNQTTSECLQCELLREEKAEKFLEGLKITLEMMNTQHC